MIVLLALIQQLIWASLSIRWKELRLKGIKPVSAFGLVCAGLPFWLLTFIALNSYYDVNYSFEYIKFIFLWSIPVIISNLVTLFLVKYLALSELTIYKLAFSSIMGLIVDTLYFKTVFSYFMITGIVFLFISGVALTKTKKKTKMDLHKSLLILFLMSINSLFQYSVFKLGLALQPNPIIHGIFCQLLVYSVYFIYSFRHLKRDFKTKIILKKDILHFGVGIFIFTVIEAILFKALPISILVLLSVLNIFILAVYDLKKQEISLNWKTYTAGALTIIALILINF